MKSSNSNGPRIAIFRVCRLSVCLSYLSVDLFVVVVVLVDLEVDLGRRDGDLPGHGHARRHQHRRRADVYRACSSGGMKKNHSLKEDRRLAAFCSIVMRTTRDSGFNHP